MRNLLLITFFVFLFSCKNGENKDLILPDWNVGENKKLIVDFRGYSTSGQQEVFNIKVKNQYDLNVVDKDSDGYLLEILNTSKIDLETSTSNNQVDETFQMLQKLIDNIGKLSIPYTVRINNSGKVESIVEFEKVLAQFENKIFLLADSIEISDYETEILAGLVADKPTFSKDLESQLTKNVNELFEIYSKAIPFDTITEKISETDPMTGRYLDLTVKYYILSENNGIYKIKADIIWDKNVFSENDQYVENFFNKENSKSPAVSSVENYIIYEWNSNSSWIEDLKYVMDMNIDTVSVYFENNMSLK